jgi:hypothetical protein
MINIDIDIDALSDAIALRLARVINNQSAQKPVNSVNSAETFARLRARYRELGYDQKYLSEKVGLCPASMSARMTCKQPWLIDEMYRIMDLLQLPYEHLHEYFPKNGKPLTVVKGRAG